VDPCNICGGTEFAPGPRGRLTPDGQEPLCLGCRTLERHRALHRAFSVIPPTALSWRRALQFAPDRSLDPSWFRSYEGSVYGGKNSIDVTAIDRVSDSYDFISLSLVLEFVRDDRGAFAELVRVGSPRCILHCTLSFKIGSEHSSHYDPPKGVWGYYHEYGCDLEEWFGTAQHGLSTLLVRVADPVTRHDIMFFLFCRDRDDAETLNAAFAVELPESVFWHRVLAT
jgi:hypothetical protein